MMRRCEPLWDGDDNHGRGHCGRRYDDAHHWTICPHRPLNEPPEGRHG